MSKTRKSQPMTLKPQQTQSQLSISATAVFDIDASADGSTPAALPKFRMVAYTGGPMRVSGWRYPVIIDLAGMSIPSGSPGPCRPPTRRVRSGKARTTWPSSVARDSTP